MTTLLAIGGSLLTGAVSIWAGVLVRNWLIERRIKANTDMRVGNVFAAVHTAEGRQLLGECYVVSLAGNRVIFEAVDGSGRLNVANGQFGSLWPIRSPGQTIAREDDDYYVC